MHVVATKPGYFGGKTRKPGDTFTLTDPAQLSKRWMLDLETPEGAAYLQAFRSDAEAPKRVGKRDALTGERLAAGGVAEQLSISLDENRTLKHELGELRAEINALRAKLAEAQPPTKDLHPAETPEADKQESTATTRVRRRVKSTDQ